MRVTYHHNYFDGTKTRHPRVRHGEAAHVFNNYYRGNEYGIASVMDAGVIVEGNSFVDVEHPMHTRYGDSPEPGRLNERKNVFLDSGSANTRGEVDESLLTYVYRLDKASAIPKIVSAGAGVGKMGN